MQTHWFDLLNHNKTAPLEIKTTIPRKSGNRAKDIEARKIRKSIQKLILAGVVTEAGIYSALIAKKVINPEKKSLGAVKMLILRSRKTLGVAPPERGVKKKKIIELFGKGLSAAQIMEQEKTSVSYTTQCLIGAGLMKRKYSHKKC